MCNRINKIETARSSGNKRMDGLLRLHFESQTLLADHAVANADVGLVFVRCKIILNNVREARYGSFNR